MQQLIASYLFQHKTCPLPGLGTLLMQHSPAKSDFLNKTIAAPQSQICFDLKESDADQLVDYIAIKTNSPVLTAIDALGKYCNQLKTELNAGNIAAINMVGSFTASNDGTVQFKPMQLPATLLPAVEAERVIHPEAAHNMLVGDRETTNTAMTEYYTETAVAKNYWWVWALVLAVAGLAALLFYFSNSLFSTSFGNIAPVK
jgi:hypothetical protein